MTDDDTARSPIEHAVDVLVYAPIGLFFEAPSLLPKLVEDGRGHARTARVFGEMAVRQGRHQLRRHVATLEDQAGSVLRTFGVVTDHDEPSPSPAPASPVAAPSAGAGTAPAGALDAAAAPAADELAITDYDSLSASQVVTRLDGLAADELEAVRLYETVNRGRKTILNKVGQLQT